MLRLLMAMAEHTKAQYKTSKQGEPKEYQARSLVYELAKDIKRITGELPPSNRYSWFCDFAKEAGAILDLPAGPRIVNEAIKHMKNGTCPNPIS